MLDLVIDGVRPYGTGDPVAIAIRDGVIDAIEPDAHRLSAAERLDARGGIVYPSFVEPHIHLDKVLTRAPAGADAATWAEAGAAQSPVKRTLHRGLRRRPRIPGDRACDRERGRGHAGSHRRRHRAGARLARGSPPGEGALGRRDRHRDRRADRGERRRAPGAPGSRARSDPARRRRDRRNPELRAGRPRDSSGTSRRCSTSPRSSARRSTCTSTTTRIRLRRCSSCSPT